jgi:hypothetical protein
MQYDELQPTEVGPTTDLAGPTVNPVLSETQLLVVVNALSSPEPTVRSFTAMQLLPLEVKQATDMRGEVSLSTVPAVLDIQLFPEEYTVTC